MGWTGDRQAVDGADQVACGVVAGLVAFEAGEALLGQKLGQAVGDVAAIGFVGGEEDEQVGVAATEPGDEAPGAEDDLGVGGAGEGAGSGFRVGCFGGELGPLEDGAVRVGGIGGGEQDELWLGVVGLERVAHGTKQVDGWREGRTGWLRGRRRSSHGGCDRIPRGL